MACEHNKFEDGSTAIICGPRRRKKFCACGRECEFLCDWKMYDRGGKLKGTCDRPLCAAHALQVAPEKHLCPEHQKANEVWKRHRSVVPVQTNLFEVKP